MAKFHINKKGVPSPCRAKTGNCPFGGGEAHFENKDQAQKFIDKQNEKKHGLLANSASPEVNRTKVVKLLKKYGFNYYDEDDLANSSQLELTSKARGDGHESYTMDVFGQDYNELKKLTEELNIRLPEIVWYD